MKLYYLKKVSNPTFYPKPQNVQKRSKKIEAKCKANLLQECTWN